MAENAVVFDGSTAARVIKATRAVEAGGISPEQSRNKPSFSLEQIVVPRSGPDGSGYYTCDIYVVDDPAAGTYTQVTTGMKVRVLPDTL
jgi:hypothetical protein